MGQLWSTCLSTHLLTERIATTSTILVMSSRPNRHQYIIALLLMDLKEEPLTLEENIMSVARSASFQQGRSLHPVDNTKGPMEMLKWKILHLVAKPQRNRIPA